MGFKILFVQMLAIVLAWLPPLARAGSSLPEPVKVTAFVNVNVIPMDDERVLERQTVIVRDGRIVEIGASADVRVPPAAERIEGRGRYLLPGLVDMHAHLNSPHELSLYLANGVTTVYNLNGRPAHILWRERIVKGEMLGPSIYTCGPTIRTAQKADEARRIVDEQNRAGYDSIKVYNGVSKEAYDVLIDEAKKHRMLVVGHIPREPGAEFLTKGEFGTVAVGKRADLLLTDGNPLQDINSLSHPAGVMVRGSWLSRMTLRQMLSEVPAAYAKEERFLITALQRDANKAVRYLEDNDPFDNLLNAAVSDSVAKRGIAWFKSVYRGARRNNQQSPLVQENFINALGYRLLEQKMTRAAIEVFKFNVEAYPKSANTYDSLAEAYLGIGEKKLAIEYYKKALEVNSDYPNAATVRELLKKLEAGSKPTPRN